MLKICVPALVLAICAPTFMHAAAKRALLIGINDYSASRLGVPRVPPAPDRDWRDLRGAVRDAEAMREMLVALYGFEERDIVTLTDQDATRAAILQALEQHLVKSASKGDVLLFYFAGHGAQVRNSRSDEADRLDETIVPADSRLGVRDIRDKELRAWFASIVECGARLTIVLDNCYSGSGARGLPTGAQPRAVKLDPRDLADATKYPPPPEDRGALVLSATHDTGQAWETRDLDGQLHGAFSWALLRAMRDAAPDESASETFLRAAARMRAETPFQGPVIAGTPESRRTPLLGARSERRAERAVISVEKVLSDGTVLLHGGWANGLSIGTELRIVSDRDITARLRVTAMTGLGRCQARIEPGHTLPQAVKSGALLEVAAWSAPAGRPLRVWTPRTSGDAQTLAALARRLHAEASRRGIRWVADPLNTTPTHVLRWGDAAWELLAGRAIEHLGPDARDALGAVLKMTAGASLFVQFPAPAAMIDGIAIGAGNGREGIDPADRPEEADYVLVGRYSARRLQYAWMRCAVTAADRRRTGLPLRSEWISEDGGGRTPRDSVAALRDAIVRLRRIHGWNLLESPPGGRSPYRIALRRSSTGELARDALIGDERYDILLQNQLSPFTQVKPRFVYLFVIDSHGRSTLLFPRRGTENRLPLSDPAPREIPISELAFEIAPPWGIDTYFLLTSDEALSDPWVLEWGGVRKRTAASPTALDRLLAVTGTGKRGGSLLAPATWSIERVFFESVPARASRK